MSGISLRVADWFRTGSRWLTMPTGIDVWSDRLGGASDFQVAADVGFGDTIGETIRQLGVHLPYTLGVCYVYGEGAH